MNEKKEKFQITVKSSTKDLFAFTKLVPTRNKRIQKASSEPITSDPINELASKLHPRKQYLVIDDIKDETKSTKTIKLIPDPESSTEELAYFRAGQYLSLKLEINGATITRPYSISSSPSDSLKGYYEITIRKTDDGFFTPYMWENWKKGTKVIASDPSGHFYYDNLRDLRNIVAIGGGSGITPFRSIAKQIVEGKIDAKLTIIYGSSEEDDIIFYDEFKELEKNNPDKIKVIIVLSCEEVTLEGCEQGFITAEIIKKYIDVEKSSFFICGPQIMYDFVDKELAKLNLPLKRIRKELFGEIKKITEIPGFPKDLIDKTFNIKVFIGNQSKEITAKASETVLVALERAGLTPPSTCRSGECGFCRSLLISGKVFVSPVNDGRREADKKFNFFHPCSSYPITDLEIIVPRSS
ncbi:MAG: FAD-binding oxidoreductase [Candidatus Hermodarchaeota archaeon]